MKTLLLFGSNSRNSGGLYNSVRSLGQSMMELPGVEPVALAHNDEYSMRDVPAYAPLPIETYSIIGPANFGYSGDLADKIESIKPDILHPQCIWMYSSYQTLRYHKKEGKPYIVSPRGMLDPWIVKNNGWKKKIAGVLFEKEHLKQATCLHALARNEYEAMRTFGCNNPIAIIPNGVNLPADKTPADMAVPMWKGNDNRKVMLFLSRLHPKKGIENLMRAWSNLSKTERGEWKLAIAGESATAEYFQSLIELQNRLGLHQDVFFIGPQFHADKDVCFRSADAFILPSYSEGLPMAVLEAWAYKLPVIITEACNLPEGFEKNAALKIMPDVDDILTQLKQFFLLPDEIRQEVGNNGFTLVKEKFTWHSIAQQMVEIYNWILAGGDAPSTIIK